MALDSSAIVPDNKCVQGYYSLCMKGPQLDNRSSQSSTFEFGSEVRNSAYPVRLY